MNRYVIEDYTQYDKNVINMAHKVWIVSESELFDWIEKGKQDVVINQ